MNEATIWENLRVRLEDNGFRAKILPAARASEAWGVLRQQHDQGLMPEKVFHDYLDGIDSKANPALPGAKSVIVTTAFHPQIKVWFEQDGRSLTAITPPTYAHDTDQQIQDILTTDLEPQGYQVVKGSVPLKLMAVRSGLARYGRNNIAYTKGQGSFQRLAAFFTDLPCPEDDWGSPQMLERCEDCSACIKACPAGVIDRERFLVSVDRCLTLYNEDPNPFPDFINPVWQSCTVGCMTCQKVCPENTPFLKHTADGPRFTEQETAAILEGRLGDDMPPVLSEKLTQAGLSSCLKELPRNLALLVQNQ